MTYQELRENRFAYEIFFDVAMGRIFCWDDRSTPSYMKKSVAKVLDTIWAMRSSIQEKGAVRHPWDTQDSFRNFFVMVMRDMYYLGILAKSKGPGEVNGYYLIERYGANYLCGDVGYMGLCRSAVTSVWHDDPHAIEQVEARFEHINRTYYAELAVDDVARNATLDERKLYYRNACKTAYVMGYALANQDWAVHTVNWNEPGAGELPHGIGGRMEPYVTDEQRGTPMERFINRHHDELIQQYAALTVHEVDAVMSSSEASGDLARRWRRLAGRMTKSNYISRYIERHGGTARSSKAELVEIVKVRFQQV